MWANSWARIGRIATANRGSRSSATGSRIAGRNAPTSIGRATSGPALNSGVLRRPRTPVNSVAASRTAGQWIGGQDRRRRVAMSHPFPARHTAPITPKSQNMSATEAGLNRWISGVAASPLAGSVTGAGPPARLARQIRSRSEHPWKRFPVE